MDRWLVLMILGQFVFAGFIIWVFARSREARMRQRSEERMRMLERLSSAQEVNEFLSSPAGARFLDVLGGPGGQQSAHPAKALSSTVTAGIITFFAGAAFLILATMLPGQAFRVPGVLGLLVGMGILLSAVVSAWLYRRAGLMPPKD